jgi:hypothetical protein
MYIIHTHTHTHTHTHIYQSPGVFCTCFYNLARRLRLEKLLLLHLELSRSSIGYFKPLLDPGGGFASETAENWNGRYVNFLEAKRLQIYNGYM